MALPGNSSGQGKSCTISKTCVCIVWVSSALSMHCLAPSVPVDSTVAQKRVPTQAPAAPIARTPATALPVARPPRGEDGKAGHLAHLDYSLQERHGAHTPGVTSGVGALGHEEICACFGSPYGRIAVVHEAEDPDARFLDAGYVGRRVAAVDGDSRRLSAERRVQ